VVLLSGKSVVVVREEWCGCQGGVVLLSGRSGIVVREEWCCCQGGVVWLLSDSSRKCIILFKILQALVIEASPLPVHVPSIASSNA
jgi:hypothetical protein